jgi:hypothetical protein
MSDTTIAGNSNYFRDDGTPITAEERREKRRILRQQKESAEKKAREALPESPNPFRAALAQDAGNNTDGRTARGRTNARLAKLADEKDRAIVAEAVEAERLAVVAADPTVQTLRTLTEEWRNAGRDRTEEGMIAEAIAIADLGEVSAFGRAYDLLNEVAEARCNEVSQNAAERQREASIASEKAMLAHRDEAMARAKALETKGGQLG